MAERSHWTGVYELGPDEARRWRLGPLTLLVGRQGREWRLATTRGEDPFDPAISCADPVEPDAFDRCEWRARCAAEPAASRLELRPAAADRTVVIRADAALIVPPRVHVDLYVDSPAWVQVLIAGQLVAEMPTYRPPDTWFGDGPTRGELCYAGQARASLHAGEVASSPTRLSTTIHVQNAGDAPITIDRLALPLPAMALFLADSDRRLWTPAVELRLEGSGSGRGHVTSAPPAEVGRCQRVAPARRAGDNGFVRVLGQLLSFSGD